MPHGWSLEREDWIGLSELLVERRWKHVKLGELYQDSVPNSSGVDSLCTAPPDFAGKAVPKLYNAVYVGKATSLRRRYLQHCMNPSPDVARAKSCFGVLEFWFTLCDEEQLDMLEGRMYQCLRPSANRVFPAHTILATVGVGRPA